MSATTLNIGGHLVTIAMLLTAVAVLQWLVFAAISASSKSRVPKQGLRPADRKLIISSIVFVLLWGAAFASFGGPKKAATEAAVVTTKSQGSCSSVDVGTPSAVVKSRIGEPDEKRNDEETRGPSATMWIYRGSRCVVHIFDDKVEFVD